MYLFICIYVYTCSCMQRNLRLVCNYCTLCVERLGTANQKHKRVASTVSLWTTSCEAQGYNRFDKQIRLNRAQEV